jgi:hypothetical protein
LISATIVPFLSVFAGLNFKPDVPQVLGRMEGRRGALALKTRNLKKVKLFFIK